MSLFSIFNIFDLTSLWIPLTVSLILYLIKYIKAKCRRDPRMVEFAKTLLGPSGFPFIGNSMDFYRKGDTLKLMLEYKEKYGDIYRIWIGKYLAVGLSDIEDLENAFMQSKMLGKPKINLKIHSPTTVRQKRIFSVPLWRKMRKIFQPLYNHSVLHTYTSTMNDKIDDLVIKMKNLVDGPEFDAWDFMAHLSFDIALKATMNVDLDWDDKLATQYHVAIANATKISFRRICFPWLQHKFIDYLFYKKQSQKFRADAVEFLHKSIQDKKQEILQQIESHKNKTADSEDIPPKTYLTLCYELAESENNENILYDELLDILTGGTDSPSVIISLFLLSVAIYQDIQNKLYDELYEIFGDSDRPANENDMDQLPYLDKVLKETLRRFPMAPVMFREAEEDTKLGNRVIPAGTIIMISAAAVQFNPKYYPDPWKFNPENFSPEAIEKRHKLSFLAFSAGIHFTMLEMKLTLSTLLRNFSFYTKMKMEDIHMDNGFAMTSVNGYKFTIKERIRKPFYL